MGGGSFCTERLSMNVPFDRYHTKANKELGGRRKGQVIHFHSAGDA